jgi:hypothetical protein
MVDRASGAGDLSDAALTCRILGHAWEWVRDYNKITGSHGKTSMVTAEVVCGRGCGVSRDDFYDQYNMTTPSGHSPHRYRHPDNYLMEPGHRLTSAEARMEHIERMNNSPADGKPTARRRKRPT